MTNEIAGVALGAIIVIGAIVGILLGVYHFLIFPNVDGVAQDIDWYNYDKDSQHFIYWFWFWTVGIGTGGGLLTMARQKS